MSGENHTPDPVDVHVGMRMRARRKELGQTQEGLAALLRISFQQVQKYERGANRVSASMLHRAATHQDVPVGFYYEGLEQAEGLTTLSPEARDAREWLGSSAAWSFAKAMTHLPERFQRSVLKVAQDLAEASV